VPEVHLLTDMTIALAVALAGGLAARAIGLPPLVGYLVAGVVLSPFTAGPSADIEALQEVADLGVIFLMFGIGLSFELSDLRQAGKVAIPGSLMLMAIIGSAGFAIGTAYGLRAEAALVLGFALAVCSSAALSRSLASRGLAGSVVGRISIAWAAVEDLGTVVMLAVLPALGTGEFDPLDLAADVGRALAFVAVMLVAGPRVLPPVLRRIALLGSRELFILAVVSLALGIATTATIFDVSIALGAFIAGVVLSETEMGHQATADVLPLREAFAVLFFVSVGMLLDPGSLLDAGWLLPAAIGVVVVLRTVAVVGIFALLPHSGHQALLIGASLAQIGEFSFLIVDAGLAIEAIDHDVYDVVLATSVASLVLNQLLLMAAPAGSRWLASSGPLWRALQRGANLPRAPGRLDEHVVIVGFGRVGQLIGHAMDSARQDFIIIESNLDRTRRLDSAGRKVVWGDAANDQVLEQASVDGARLIVIALPDHATTVLAITNIRRLAPRTPILVRAHGSEELHLIRQFEVQEVVVPEFEGGLELVHQSLLALGFSNDDAEGYRLAIRDIHYGSAAQYDTVV
jgi:CPA2 family monovalent cation:H+ antiporter-2